VVTLGAEGSFFRIAAGGEHVPPFVVRTVDATGCGDAFVAGLLCQLIAAKDWREQLLVPQMRQVLRYANAVGALTSMVQGVIPALPSATQVEGFLALSSQNTWI
jgi:fructokinase